MLIKVKSKAAGLVLIFLYYQITMFIWMNVQQLLEGASEDWPSSGSPPSPRWEAPAWKRLRRRWTEKTLPSSQYREGDASLVDVEAGVGALLEPPESKSTWQDGSRMDRVKNWKNYEGLTNHPLHVVVEGLLGLARSSSLTDRVVLRRMADRNLANRVVEIFAARGAVVAVTEVVWK